MCNNFSISENVLFKNDTNFKTFPSPVEKFLLYRDSIFVLLRYSAEVGNRTIFCFDFESNEMWRISEPITLHAENYFSSIYFRNEELYAYNINGVEYHLDKENGHILDSELIK